MEIDDAGDGTRHRIVVAAARLLTDGGPDAVSTRAVGAAAGVQAPTIYRLFGDKQGLLDAVASHGFTAYLASKAGVEPTDDPVEDLRAGWDLHVGLGLADPSLYALMYVRPRPGASASPAADAAFAVLATHIRRIAEAGRLRVPEERAAALVHAAGSGTTLTLIATPEQDRDPGCRTPRGTPSSPRSPPTRPPWPCPARSVRPAALRAQLAEVDVLTASERGLLREWLDRIVHGERGVDGATGPNHR